MSSISREDQSTGDFEFSDAMLAVRDMIDAAVRALDSVELRRADTDDD